MSGALTGITVLDLSNWIAGPFGTTTGRSRCRHYQSRIPRGRRLSRPGAPFPEGETHFFMGINRNKRNLILDLKTAPGQEVARTIARRCDVLVQNMRPGVAERYGLGYDTLRTENPASST